MQIIPKFLYQFRPRLLKNNIYILTYHGVVEQYKDPFWERNFTLLSHFKDHLAFYRKHAVLTTEELLHLVQKNVSPSRPCFYITFDDGYKNNLTAADLFHKDRIPWTLFISTQSISTGAFIWTIDLALMFKESLGKKLNFGERLYSLENRESQLASFNSLRKKLKELPAPDRIIRMQQLQTELAIGDITVLRNHAPEFAMMNWNDIRAISPFTEIGSHGVTHELLHAKQSVETIRIELTTSKAQIERELQKPCTLYAYPNGDYCETATREVQNAGYQLAFTTVATAAKAPFQHTLLPRTDAVINLDKLRTRLSNY